MEWNQIAMLLHITKETRDQPKLKAIHEAANAELEAHAAGPLPSDVADYSSSETPAEEPAHEPAEEPEESQTEHNPTVIDRRL